MGLPASSKLFYTDPNVPYNSTKHIVLMIFFSDCGNIWISTASPDPIGVSHLTFIGISVHTSAQNGE